MQQNFHQSPEREQIDETLKRLGKNINGEVSFTLEQGLMTNISSPDADKYMQSKIKAATDEFVKAHVEGGVDKFTQESIKLSMKQLALIEQEKRDNKAGTSPKPKEISKVSQNILTERDL